MSSFVGQENYPNVYICNIEVSDAYPDNEDLNIVNVKVSFRINSVEDYDFDFTRHHDLLFISSKSELFSQQLTNSNNLGPLSSPNSTIFQKLNTLQGFDYQKVQIQQKQIIDLQHRKWVTTQFDEIYRLHPNLGTHNAPLRYIDSTTGMQRDIEITQGGGVRFHHANYQGLGS